jgi:hypothetical protein
MSESLVSKTTVEPVRPRVYVAGPMRGRPNNNEDEFKYVTGGLRAMGFDVVSPLEVCADMPKGLEPEDYLRRDIAALVTCDGIVLLDGWHDSVGARAEAGVALACGLKFYSVRGEPFAPGRIPRSIGVAGYDRPTAEALA